MDIKEPTTFDRMFDEALANRNLSLEKLSELSNVPIKYIEAIQRGDASKLPPSPYVRGYIAKLADLLEIKSDELWALFQKESQLKAAGIKDKMPENRYAQRPAHKSLIIGLGIGLLLVLYVGYRLNSLTGRPLLNVLYPDTATLILNTPSVLFRGTLDISSKLIINNERVNINEEGAWEKKIVLQPGLNSIEIKATKILGRQTEVVKQVIYNPPPFSTSSKEESNSENE